MIIGIGTDIIEIVRIKKAVERWGYRFLNKIYTEKEISYCYQRKDTFTHLAGRFAAKEAAIKAFTGINKNAIYEKKIKKAHNKLPHSLNDFINAGKTISFKEIEISNDNYGRPFVILNIFDFNAEEIAIYFHLTISHEKSYAVATVIIEIGEF